MFGVAPSLIIFVLGIGATLGVLGYTYHQGKQSCISFYEAQSLANKIKNQMDEIANYKTQQEYSDKLVGEALEKQLFLEKRNEKLQLSIDQIIFTKNVCVNDSFLLDLTKLRESSGKKNNTKSTK